MSEVVQSAIAQAPQGGHLLHILLLVAWFPIFGIILFFEKMTVRNRARRLNVVDEPLVRCPAATKVTEVKTCGSPWLQATALASFGAAVVHAAVMPDHFKESVIYGLFFLCASVGQLAFGVLILARPSRRLVGAGILGSGLVVVLWLVSRTLGVPIGPNNGAAESFGLLDALASSYEAATVVFGILALRAWTPVPAWRWSKWAPALRLAAPLCIAGTIAASVLSARS